MSDNLSVHLRITGLAPSNEDVDSRRTASTQLANQWARVRDVSSVLDKAAAIAEALGGDGLPSTHLGEEVQRAVQKTASAFLYQERPLEVGICAAMAAVNVLRRPSGDVGWTTPVLLANALWSALAFQPPLAEEKREALRREVLDLSRQRSLDSANKARARVAVAEPVDLEISLNDGAISSNFETAIQQPIAALRRNSALDREELDFLWWVQLNRSRLLKRPFSAISETTRLITSGIEAAEHLLRLPAQVHRDLVLRTAESDPLMDLPELLEAMGQDRELLAAPLLSNTALSHSTIFPLLRSLIGGHVSEAGAAVKRRAVTWGGRALLEASLARMVDAGVVKL